MRSTKICDPSPECVGVDAGVPRATTSPHAPQHTTTGKVKWTHSKHVFTAAGAGRVSLGTAALQPLPAALGHRLQNRCGCRTRIGTPAAKDQSREEQGTLTFHSLAHLVSHVPYLVDGVGQIVVVLQEVKGAEPQQFKGDAHVAMVVKPVKHPDTKTERKSSDLQQICTHTHQAPPFLTQSAKMPPKTSCKCLESHNIKHLSHSFPATALKRRSPFHLTTHFVFSGSFSLIFSSTLISSRAASLYFSTFLMILRATRAPPLREKQEEDARLALSRVRELVPREKASLQQAHPT